MTFTVSLKKNLPSLARIDAQASIYFDKNEPIDTPPIFNTVQSYKNKKTVELWKQRLGYEKGYSIT